MNCGKRHLLVVDDNQQFASVMCAMMALHGWAAEAVYSMKAALDSIDAHPVEVMLLDLMLPDSDVLSTLGAIRRMQSAGCVIVVTALPITSDMRRIALEAGAKNIVSKMATNFELALGEMIGRPHHETMLALGV